MRLSTVPAIFKHHASHVTDQPFLMPTESEHGLLALYAPILLLTDTADQPDGIALLPLAQALMTKHPTK